MTSAALDTFVNSLGWIGAVGAVFAYAMVTRGTWTPRGFPFQLTNLLSASMLCLVAGFHDVWPSVAANVVWIGVGVQAVVVVGMDRVRRAREGRVEHASTAPVEPAEAHVSLAA